MSWKFVPVWFSWLLSQLNCCVCPLCSQWKGEDVLVRILKTTEWWYWGRGLLSASVPEGTPFLGCAKEHPDSVKMRMQNFQWQIADIFYSLNTAFRVKEKGIQAFVLRTSCVMTKRDYMSVLRLTSRPLWKICRIRGSQSISSIFIFLFPHKELTIPPHLK